MPYPVDARDGISGGESGRLELVDLAVGARVKLIVNLTQSRSSHVGVHFGRGNTRMPQQLLNDPQVRPAIHQVGCETVAQHVWSQAPDPPLLRPVLDAQP